jgi:hypothetical protein
MKRFEITEKSLKDNKNEKRVKRNYNHSEKQEKKDQKRDNSLLMIISIKFVNENLGERRVRIIIDSGSDLNCVLEKWLKRVELSKKYKDKMFVRVVDGRDISEVILETVLPLELIRREKAECRQKILNVANISNNIILENR